MFRRAKWSAGLLALTLLAACGGSDGAADDAPSGSGGGGNTGGNTGGSTSTVVEMFTWWTEPGEAEALQALLDVHQASHPNVRFFNSAAEDGPNARALLEERLQNGDPPDLIQRNVQDMGTLNFNYPRLIAPLTDVYAELGLPDVMVPELHESVNSRADMKIMPVGMHRENSLLYNALLLQEHGLTPPTTLPELLAACATLKQAGITPLAVGKQEWMLRILWNVLAMGSMGADKYAEQFTGKAEPDQALIAEGVDVFAEVLANYTNSSEVDYDYSWSAATEDLYNGKVALFAHGDWAKAYLMQLGWTAGVDFGIVAAPGAPEVFLYSADGFALPVGAKNEAAARDFLATLVSPEAQIVFSEMKGSSPVRLDIPTDTLDPVSRSTLDDLKNATYRLPAEAEEDHQIKLFLAHQDRATLVKGIASVYANRHASRTSPDE